MKNCFLYSHGGSGNHGCEAIVRGTQKIIGKENMSEGSYQLRFSWVAAKVK